MAGKLISDLNSGTLSIADAMEIDKDVSGTRTSFKTTVKDIVQFANQNIADEYDSTSTYAVDDYVIYESVLYKCIASTTGTFDSTKWTSVVVTDEMGSGGGGGTGGHTIIDENGNSMTARAGLQFVGGANVSDDSTNNKTIVDLASAGGIDGVFIDTGNVIKDDFTFDGNEQTWTATDDCILSGYIDPISSSSIAYISMGNVDLFIGYDTHNALFIPIKKGQTILYKAKSGSSMKAYGIQTGTTHSKFQPVIYSTEEREIGVWTDGKPLYQKSYIGLNVEIINVNTWYNTGLSASGVEVFVEGEMIDINNQAYPVNVAFMSSNTKIGISCGMANRTGVILTIRYTKTSDVAGSGTWTPQGVPTHHYSTDEKVVGKWIDGSTLYEKTYDFSANPIDLSANSWTNTTASNSGIDKIINNEAMTSDGVNINWLGANAGTGSYIQLLNIRNSTIGIAYLTIQYTKSS